MEVLLVDPLVPEALEWLRQRHAVTYIPELADDPAGLTKAMAQARAVVLPTHVVVTRHMLDAAPRLEVVGRLQMSSGNIDLDDCARRNIRVLQARSATVRSNAEYILYGLLMLYRRGMVSALLGRRLSEVRLGREIGGSTIGLMGLSPVAHALAPMLGCLGVKLVGYDPAVHHAADVWDRLGVEAVPVQDLLERSDAVTLQMIHAPRFNGWINERLLNHCKPGQLWVGISRGSLFDAEALALALTDGRIDAMMLDGAGPQFAAPGSVLHGIAHLHLTPRLGSHTREAKMRASWYLVHRIHETLAPDAARREPTVSSEFMPLDRERYPGGSDPQNLSPSQWGALDMQLP